MMDPEMPPFALVELLRAFEKADIPAWLDGGWGVDALLGRQTRPHKDADLIVAVEDAARLRKLMEKRGFALREGNPPHSFVLADANGLEVDVHAVFFDDDGGGTHRMEDGETRTFPAGSFGGRGAVGGENVRRLSPEAQILCHAQGYEPTEKDLRDMAMLAYRFGVELPRILRSAASANESS